MDEYSKPAATRVESTAAEDPAVEIAASLDGDAEAISKAELREFLAADAFGAPADPDFKRRLKGRLWEIVEARLQSGLRDKLAAGWRRRAVPAVGEVRPEPKPKR